MLGGVVPACDPNGDQGQCGSDLGAVPSIGVLALWDCPLQGSGQQRCPRGGVGVVVV